MDFKKYLKPDLTKIISENSIYAISICSVLYLKKYLQ